jgi:hypothetical protein
MSVSMMEDGKIAGKLSIDSLKELYDNIIQPTNADREGVTLALLSCSLVTTLEASVLQEHPRLDR